MKKIILCMVSLLACVGLLVGCAPKVSKWDAVADAVSYEQDSLMVASNDHFDISLVSGKKELPIKLDGTKGEVKDFCTLTISPKVPEYFNKKYSYTLVGDKGEVTGECKRAVIGISQVADVVDIAKAGAISKVKLTIDEENVELDLTDLTKDMVKPNVVVKNVYDSLKDSIDKLFEEDSFNAEINVKISINRSADTPSYYWCVDIIGKNGTKILAMVDSASGEVTTSKVTEPAPKQ